MQVSFESHPYIALLSRSFALSIHVGYQFDLGGVSAEEYLDWALQPKEIPADGLVSEDVIHFNEVSLAPRYVRAK